MDEAEDGQGGVGQRGEGLGQAGTPGVVAVFVPPAVFDEVQAVLHLPVTANVLLEIRGRHRPGIQTGHEVPAFAGEKLTVGAAHLAINADGDSAIGNVQMLPDILGVIKAEPKPAGLLIEPLFSVTSWAGRTGVSWKKQVSKASNRSG